MERLLSKGNAAVIRVAFEEQAAAEYWYVAVALVLGRMHSQHSFVSSSTSPIVIAISKSVQAAEKIAA